MTFKTKAIIAFSCAVLLLTCFISILIFSMNSKDEPGIVEDLLSGSQLRTMMNEAKFSPGASKGFIEDHPTYAWLFDGSFVTYVKEGE